MMLASGTDKEIIRLNFRSRLAGAMIILLIILATAAILSASLGAVSVPPAQVAKVIINHLSKSVWFDVSAETDRIVWQIHIPAWS